MARGDWSNVPTPDLNPQECPPCPTCRRRSPTIFRAYKCPRSGRDAGVSSRTMCGSRTDGRRADRRGAGQGGLRGVGAGRRRRLRGNAGQTVTNAITVADTTAVEIDYTATVAQDLPNGWKAGQQLAFKGASCFQLRGRADCPDRGPELTQRRPTVGPPLRAPARCLFMPPIRHPTVSPARNGTSTSPPAARVSGTGVSARSSVTVAAFTGRP